MAVYFAPRNSNRITINDILGMVGGRFLDSMMARDEAARQYKYRSRLDAEADARKADAVKLANEEAERQRLAFIDHYEKDPRRALGGGGMLAYAPGIGYKGNVSDIAAWGLPQMLTVDQGDKKTVAPLWSGGEIGDGKSYDVGLSPKDAGDLDVKQGELKSLINYREGMLANERGRIDLAGRPMWTLLNGYTDDNGNLIERDQWGNKRPAGGIKPVVPEVDPIMRDLQILSILREGQDKGGSGGWGIDSDTSGKGDTPGFVQTLKETIAEDLIKRLYPQLGGNGNVPFSGYTPMYKNIGDGGLNAYSSALGGPASAGGATRSPQTAGSGGKRISMADINKEARIQNRPPADLVREAQESGFTVY